MRGWLPFVFLAGGVTALHSVAGLGTLFFWLLVGHAVADFALQSDAMARGKNRNQLPENVPPGQRPQVVWPYWLTAHALIHAGAVTLVTGSVTLGVLELAVHWAIDFAKCESWTGIHTDQALHVGCKLLWAVLV